MPYLVVIAGPNGAGKSTAAPGLLEGLLGIEDFVNADVIARGLSAFNPEGAAIEAGRIMLRRVRELADEGKDLAFETTLASRSFAPWIARLRRDHGYELRLDYLWIPGPELSIGRISGRVRDGGHFVPDDTVRRRYAGGLRNFFELYRPIADRWRVFDNHDSAVRLRPVAEGRLTEVAAVYDEQTWDAIRKEHDR